MPGAEAMINANLRLVFTIARITPISVATPDLIAEGNLGLTKAVEAL